jgi:hypothetical protein
MADWKPALTPEQAKPQNDIEALTLALHLALTAPTDEQSQKAVKLANELSSRLTKEQVDAVIAALSKDNPCIVYTDKAELEVERADV